MKKTILFLALCLCLQVNSFAQNNIQLNIHHKLGTSDFAMNMGAKNNIENDFNVSRLQYYVSNIELTHDGGQVTAIEGHTILVDGKRVIEENLGDYEINEVESISFYIGVDPDENHLDPALWPNGHPLAPMFPSMHWGWAAGYRFVAIEGQGGSNYNQLYELHGLGDNNYYQTQIPVVATATDNAIVLNIDADYTRVLENIAVANGPIVHGTFGDAKKALENFRDYVFTATGMVSSIEDFTEISSIDLFPNPTRGISTLFIKASENETYQVQIVDVLGQTIESLPLTANTPTLLDTKNTGIYFVQVLKDGQLVTSKKLIVQ